MLYAQATDQDAFDELLGREGGKTLVEMPDIGRLNAFIGDHFELFAQRGEPSRCRVGGEVLARVRLEGDDGRQQIPGLGGVGQSLEQRTVAQVDTIEIADGQHGSAGRNVGKAAIDKHQEKGAKRGRKA